jgi:hypothetical protein
MQKFENTNSFTWHLHKNHGLLTKQCHIASTQVSEITIKVMKDIFLDPCEGFRFYGI